eukprot:m51a1_g792 hypothetical protein (629) ;mRNA; f:636733-638917
MSDKPQQSQEKRAEEKRERRPERKAAERPEAAKPENGAAASKEAPQRKPRELTPEEKASQERVKKINDDIAAKVARMNEINREVWHKDRTRELRSKYIQEARENVAKADAIIAEQSKKVADYDKEIKAVFDHAKGLRTDSYKIKSQIEDILAPYVTKSDYHVREVHEPKADANGKNAKDAAATAAAAPAAEGAKDAKQSPSQQQHQQHQRPQMDLLYNDADKNIALIDRKIRELEAGMATTSTIKEERALIQQIGTLRQAKALAREFARQLGVASHPVRVDEVRAALSAARSELNRARAWRVSSFRNIERSFADIEENRKNLPELLVERNKLIDEIRKLVEQTHEERERCETARYNQHKEEQARLLAAAEKDSRERKDRISEFKRAREERERVAAERTPYDDELALADELAEHLRAEAPAGLALPQPGAAAAPAGAAAEKPRKPVVFKAPAPAKAAAIEEEGFDGAQVVLMADKSARNAGSVEQFEREQKRDRAKAKSARKGAQSEEPALAIATEPIAPKQEPQQPQQQKKRGEAAQQQDGQKKKRQDHAKQTAALNKQMMLQSPMRHPVPVLRDFERFGVKAPTTFADIPEALTAIYKKKEVLVAKRQEAAAMRKAATETKDATTTD